MIDFICSHLIIAFSIGVFAGLTIGIFSTLHVNKNKIEVSKVLNIILFFVWIGVHLWSIANRIDVPFLFDIVGGASVGHILGLNLIEIINKIRK